MSPRIVAIIVLLGLLASVGAAVAQIECPPGQVEWNGMCVDPLTDERYCGATPWDPGIVCPSGYRCEFGSCVLSCPAGQLACNGLCVDPMKDEDNCGTCGNVCDPGFLCENGQCVPCAPVSSDEVPWGVVKSYYR